MVDENKISLDDSLRVFVKSSIFVFVGLFLSKLLSWLFRIVIANYLHKEIYGLFSLASFICDVLVAVLILGLGVGSIRFISYYRGKGETSKISYIFRVSFFMVLLASIIGGILLMIFSSFISISIFHNSKLALLLFYFGFSIPITVLGNYFLSVIQGYEKIEWYSFIRNILFNFIELIVIIIGIIIVFVDFDKNPAYFPYIIISSYLLGAISLLIPSIIYCKIKLPEIFKKPSLSKETKKALRKELFAYSIPLLFVGLSYLMFTSIDSFFLGFYKDVSVVGIYNVAVPIASFLTIASYIFVFLFLPTITREFAKNNLSMIKDISKQVGKWVFMLNIPILVLFILFPGAIINILFPGPEYMAAIWPLRFLSIGVFVNSLFLFSENLLSMKGKSKVILMNLLIALSVNVALNLILIPLPSIFGLDNSMGIVGASMATMTSNIIWGLLSLFTARKFTGVMPLKRKMIIIGLSVLVPAIILLVIRRFIVMNVIVLIGLVILFF